jgi:hypothetical protein
MKTALIASFAGIGLLAANSAHAQVTINISGAVAFRDTAYRAIRGLYGANLASENPDTPATPSTSLRVTWTGQIPSLFGEQAVTIHAYYNGAVAGIQDLTGNRDVRYLSSSTPGDTNTVLLKSDVAFGSVFQQSTPYTTPVLEDHRFGVTPVFFVKSSTAPAGLTNITVQQYRTLAANGALPGWFFTGNTNDTDLIYYISRDPTAGQRVIVQRENGFSGTPIFYQWDTTAQKFVADPTGRNSTQIRDALKVSGPAISYLTGVDAVNVNGGANILAFNGVRPVPGAYSSTSNDLSAVAYGQYTQWGYEHILNLTTASQNVKSFRDKLLAAIDQDLQSSAHSLPISKVHVERSAEGGPLSPIE